MHTKKFNFRLQTQPKPLPLNPTEGSYYLWAMWLRTLLERAKWLGGSLLETARRQSVGFWIVFSVGAVITALITFPNHYNFRTCGTELAFNAQMVHFFAHAENPFRPTMGGLYGYSPEPHFSLHYILSVPFYWIFGVWGVILAQWIAILWGAVGVYRYGFLRLKSDGLAALAMGQYFGMWGILSFLAFDVHEFLSVALPWVFFYLESREFTKAAITWAIFITAKENIAVWGVWMAIVLLLIYREKQYRRIIWKLLAISLIWTSFYFSITHILRKEGFFPSKSADRIAGLYSYLAEDPSSNTSHSSSVPIRIAQRFLKNPQLIIHILWGDIPPSSLPTKKEVYIATMASGGWTLLFQPLMLIILVPVYLYKFAASDCQIWGLLNHYNLEFAVFLPISVIRFASTCSQWLQFGTILLSLIGAWIIHFYTMNRPLSCYLDPKRYRWYNPIHYCSPYNYSKIHAGLKKIPRNESVSVVAILAPHVPPRREYYHFPEGLERVMYIGMLRSNPSPWPLSRHEDAFWIDSLSRSSAWEKIHDQDRLVIFRRR